MINDFMGLFFAGIGTFLLCVSLSVPEEGQGGYPIFSGNRTAFQMLPWGVLAITVYGIALGCFRNIL